MQNTCDSMQAVQLCLAQRHSAGTWRILQLQAHSWTAPAGLVGSSSSIYWSASLDHPAQMKKSIFWQNLMSKSFKYKVWHHCNNYIFSLSPETSCRVVSKHPGLLLWSDENLIKICNTIKTNWSDFERKSYGRTLNVLIPATIHISTEHELENKTVMEGKWGKGGLIKETMYPSWVM